MATNHQFRVKPGEAIRLVDVDPDHKGKHQDSAEAAPEIQHYAERLRELQYLLYAEGQRGLLICLQAMDAGGKDGTIRHVLGFMNPQGCRVQSFKVPTPEEAAHDFLWRAHRAVPGLGEVAIFNRSYYEDVLVTRVHNLVPKPVWSERYESINAFEKHLADNGVLILKFFLHISKDEQLDRFRKRLEDPARHWKISESDYTERDHWDSYQRAYGDALSQCSTDWAPWFIIPANHKWFRNLVVSQIVVEALESLKMKFPPPKVDIESIRRKYHAELKKSKNGQ